MVKWFGPKKNSRLNGTPQHHESERETEDLRTYPISSIYILGSRYQMFDLILAIITCDKVIEPFDLKCSDFL